MSQITNDEIIKRISQNGVKECATWLQTLSPDTHLVSVESACFKIFRTHLFIYTYIRDVIDYDFIIVIIELIIIDYYRLLDRFKEQIMSFKMPQTRLF